MRRRLILLVGFALSTAIPAAASAQPSAAAIEASKRAAAEEANKAFDAYQAGRYAEAITGFRSAERAFHAPKFLLYIARAQGKLGQLAAAKRTYDAIVQEQLTTYAPPEFFAAQTDARKELGELTARIAAAEAAASASAAAAASPPPSAVTAPSAAPAAPSSSSADASAPASGVPTVTYVAYAAGAVGLIAGAVFGGLTLAKKAEFDATKAGEQANAKKANEAADQGEAFAHAATAGFATAIVGAAVGTIFWLRAAPSAPKRASADSGGSLFVAPRIGGVTVGGTF